MAEDHETVPVSDDAIRLFRVIGPPVAYIEKKFSWEYDVDDEDDDTTDS